MAGRRPSRGGTSGPVLSVDGLGAPKVPFSPSTPREPLTDLPGIPRGLTNPGLCSSTLSLGSWASRTWYLDPQPPPPPNPQPPTCASPLVWSPSEFLSPRSLEAYSPEAAVQVRRPVLNRTAAALTCAALSHLLSQVSLWCLCPRPPTECGGPGPSLQQAGGGGVEFPCHASNPLGTSVGATCLQGLPLTGRFLFVYLSSF